MPLKNKVLGFIDITCPKTSNLKDLKSIGVVVRDEEFFAEINEENTLEKVSDDLNKWLLKFDEKVYIAAIRQKEVEVFKELMKNQTVFENVVIKVYLKMIFENMYDELKKKGLSLIHISFLYDLSQGVFEKEQETHVNMDKDKMNNVDFAKTYLGSFVSTVEHLSNLPKT